MGLFDNIAKKAQEAARSVSDTYDSVSKTVKEKAQETARSVSDTCDSVSKTVKEKTVGELIDAGIKSGSEVINTTGELITTKAKEIKEGAEHLTMEDVGNYAKRMGKLASGMTAYEQRKYANEKKEKADRIVKETTQKIEQVRFLANTRLETFGRSRCEMLKTTVGRFIRIVNSLKNSVKAKEYDLTSSLQIKENDFKELETVEMNGSSILATTATSGSVAIAALAGVPAAVNASVAALCSASTGTAISQLSGAAARQATLAWLGGGSVATGGGGVAAGTIVLGTITWTVTGVMALASAGIVAGKIYSQKHTEAEQYLAEIQKWEAKSLAAIEVMKGVVMRSDELLSVTSRLEGRIIPALDELESLALEFNPMDQAHAKIFQRAAILVKSMSELAQTPLMDAEGNLNEHSMLVAEKTQKILNHELV